MIGPGLLLVCATVIAHMLWGLRGSDHLQGRDGDNAWKVGRQIILGMNLNSWIFEGPHREKDNNPMFSIFRCLSAVLGHAFGVQRLELSIHIL